MCISFWFLPAGGCFWLVISLRIRRSLIFSSSLLYGYCAECTNANETFKCEYFAWKVPFLHNSISADTSWKFFMQHRYFLDWNCGRFYFSFSGHFSITTSQLFMMTSILKINSLLRLNSGINVTAKYVGYTLFSWETQELTLFYLVF